MVRWWTERNGQRLAVGCLLAALGIACGESKSDDDGSGGASGSSTGGSAGSAMTGGSSTGGSGGSSTTGGSSGSGGGSSMGDPCGGCPVGQLCIYQAGGPGPGHLTCAANPGCRAAGICDCVRDQGTCMVVPPGSDMAGMCQCDNGLE